MNGIPSEERPYGMSQLDWLWTTYSPYNVSNEPSEIPSARIILAEDALAKLVSEAVSGGITDLTFSEDPDDSSLMRLAGKDVNGNILTVVKIPVEEHVVLFEARKVTQTDVDNGCTYSVGTNVLVLTTNLDHVYMVSVSDLELAISGTETDTIYCEVINNVITANVKIDENNNTASAVELKSTTKGLYTSMKLDNGNSDIQFETSSNGLKGSIPIEGGANIKFAQLTLDKYLVLEPVAGTVYFITDYPYIYLDGVRYGVDLISGDNPIISLEYNKDTMTLWYTKSDGTDAQSIVLGPASADSNGMMTTEQYEDLQKLLKALGNITSVEEYVQETVNQETSRAEAAEKELQDAIDAIVIEENTTVVDSIASHISVTSNKEGTTTTYTINESNIASTDDISSLESKIAGKQDTLTAGKNITIEDDVISASGSAAGEIDVNPTNPLRLKTTYAEDLATISGIVNPATTSEYGVVGLWSIHYGSAGTNIYSYANINSVEDLFDSIAIEDDHVYGAMHNLTSEELADVYKVSGIGCNSAEEYYDKDGNFTGYGYSNEAPLKLAVKTGWPRISTISEATKDDVEYVLCIDSNNKLKKVPVSEFVVDTTSVSYWDNSDAMLELKSKDEESFNVLDELYNLCENSSKAGVVKIVMKDECTDEDLENYAIINVDGNTYQLSRGENIIECDEISYQDPVYLDTRTTHSNYVEYHMSEIDIVGEVSIRSRIEDNMPASPMNIIYRALHPRDWNYDAQFLLQGYDFSTLVLIGGKPTRIDNMFTCVFNDSGGDEYFANSYFDLKGAFIKNFDLSECKTTDMSCFFCDCSSLSDLSPIADWQFPNVKYMSYFFYGCTSLSDLSPIADWQFPNVTDMSYFFQNCTSLSDLSPIDGWETPKITSKISNFAVRCPLTDESKTICSNHNWGC